MGLLNLFKRADMTKQLEEYQREPGAVLLDVRTPEEYGQGHIPQSRNIPLTELDEVPYEYPELDTPLYLYCLTGARSSYAVEQLRSMGYTRVCDLGGINGYRGKVER